MTTITKVNLKEVLGHMVEAEITLQGYYGEVTQTMEGRIIYSEYNASLFFKPKGSKNKGYLIQNEEDILSVKIIRKDNRNNEYYVNAYNQKETAEIKLEERQEKERKQREENDRLRKERFEMQRKAEQEKKQQEIEEAKQLGGYDELEQEVIEFYQSFKDEFFNENFVKTTYIPILNKLINKSIDSLNKYPKHYFYKEHNPKFCTLIEKKLNIKLPKTQKGSVQKLNEYLAG